MNLLNKLERKIGKYAIRNLSLYIIIAYAIGYLLALTGYMGIFTLDPNYIFNNGQIWRIVTWIIVPPGGISILMLIVLYFYYQIGTALERTWGTFRYNVYIFSGIILTILGAIALYFIAVAVGVDPGMTGQAISATFTTYYINLSIFLAFAVTYPDVHVLLFFVIPVRMKWMAYVYAVINIYQFIFVSSDIPIVATAVRIAIVMSLLNFLVFFFATRDYRRVSFKEMYRKKAYKEATRSAYNPSSANGGSGVISKHKCAICGRTEKDSDALEFRFCSKCNGNYEYCNEHLFTHKHIM